jgi:ACDE family multidrug resistance protein
MKQSNHWIFIILSSLSVIAAIVAFIAIKPKTEG